jgi:hypothetical protein
MVSRPLFGRSREWSEDSRNRNLLTVSSPNPQLLWFDTIDSAFRRLRVTSKTIEQDGDLYRNSGRAQWLEA